MKQLWWQFKLSQWQRRHNDDEPIGVEFFRLIEVELLFFFVEDHLEGFCSNKPSFWGFVCRFKTFFPHVKWHHSSHFNPNCPVLCFDEKVGRFRWYYFSSREIAFQLREKVQIKPLFNFFITVVFHPIWIWFHKVRSFPHAMHEQPKQLQENFSTKKAGIYDSFLLFYLSFTKIVQQ